jgi:hypothetical protein
MPSEPAAPGAELGDPAPGGGGGADPPLLATVVEPPLSLLPQPKAEMRRPHTTPRRRRVRIGRHPWDQIWNEHPRLCQV